MDARRERLVSEAKVQLGDAVFEVEAKRRPFWDPDLKPARHKL